MDAPKNAHTTDPLTPTSASTTRIRDTAVIGLVIAAATALSAYLILDDKRDAWPAFIVLGCLLAFVLWLILFAGSYAAQSATGLVAPKSYAIAGLIAVVASTVIGAIAGNLAFWPVGFVLAGAVTPSIPGRRGTR